MQDFLNWRGDQPVVGKLRKAMLLLDRSQRIFGREGLQKPAGVF